MILAALTPLLALSLFALPAKAQAASPSAKLKFPPYRKTKLPNGLTILLMEKHNLPLVSFNMDVKSGSTSDPAGQEGTASLAAALLRKGTKTRSAEQFSNDLDFIGGSFNTGASTDFTFISAEFMKKDLAKGLDLLSDPILNPTFPTDEFTKLVAQRKDGIRAAKDQAQGVLGTYFNAYLLGGHPYARPTSGDEQSLAQITRDAVAKFYATYYKPGNTILSVVGDFDSTEMEKALAAQFGAWANATVPAVQLSAATPAQGKHLLLVDKPDSTQTYFRIGNLGIARTSPDRVYVNVVNTLFGGRFTSMINSALRIQSGLTYGANSAFDERKAAGPFYINTYTRNATTEKAMDMALDVLKQFHEKGITEDQLTSAKSYLKGQYPLRIETSDQLASQLTDLEFYGLDAKEIDDFYPKVDAMTMADARRVIDRYYPLDNLVFVVIGKASEIGPVVKKYAPDMDTRSISEPGYWPASGAH
ncbi:MAG TPA: pitrilysin family protein [Candidatus Acidoferrales bacterium]|nr:pitrilysin family protein [Candidatus Acidoferrales bacterium]